MRATNRTIRYRLSSATSILPLATLLVGIPPCKALTYEQAPLDSVVQWAGNGDAKAMQELGRRYDNAIGVKRNSKKAARWFEKAGEAGNVWGKKWAGFMYYEGRGVRKNWSKALQWLLPAINELEHDRDIETWIGYIYYNGGEGVRRLKVSVFPPFSNSRRPSRQNLPSQEGLIPFFPSVGNREKSFSNGWHLHGPFFRDPERTRFYRGERWLSV